MMKEITEPMLNPTEIVTEVVDQDQVKKQEKFMGSWRLHPGHKCWKVDRETGECTEANYEIETVDFKDAQKGLISSRKKLVVLEEYVYICALNPRNAIRKLNQMGYNFIDPKQCKLSRMIK